MTTPLPGSCWIGARLEIDLAGAQRTFVDALVSPSVPGLAGTEARAAVALYGEFRITHIPSGLALPGAYRRENDACEMAERFAALGDWTRSVAAVLADAPLWASFRALAESANSLVVLPPNDTPTAPQ